MTPESYQQMLLTEQNHWWFVGRRLILESVIRKIIKTRGKILEIGAGTGGNLEMLMRYGNVVAIEPDDFARKKIAEKFGDKVLLINGKLPNDLNLKDGLFDMICLFDVLEHVKEDQESLLNLKAFLKPDGKIILTVPAFRFLWSSHDKYHHHHRRYNFLDLKKLIQNSDLVPIKITFFNFILFPLAALIRVFSRLPVNINLRKNNHCLTFNKILTLIFASEKFWLSKFNFPWGLSLLAVLKFSDKSKK